MTTIVALVVAAGVFASWYRMPGGVRIAFAPISIVVGMLLAFAWAMSPCGAVVEGRELRIERRAWSPLHLALETVTCVSRVDSPTRGAIRLFGVGGFFGSYGLFTSSTFGRFRLYASRGGPGVVLVRAGGEIPVILTPDDVDGTIRALERQMSGVTT